ncbi:MAG: helix-turn-helix transcriptional regulator, partial [Eubacteriales bacterium]
LIRVFHERYGITPHRYITERKIESARAFFDRTDARIAEVAQMLGFGSPQYFSRVFRECVGVTPGEYRKMRFFRT